MAEVNVRVSDSGRLFPDAVVIKVDEQEIIAGQDGISPVVTVTEIGTAEAVSSHGYEVEVSDAAGVHTYSVYDGASAYAQAVAGGYSGTEEEFAADLIGFNTRAAEATAGATAAAAYADAASDSATAAATSESNAADSATAAASSASEAASSAQAASQSAQEASASATAASQAEDNAASSATAAAGSATAAAGSASTASTAATTAQGHATNAASSATAASGSATSASSSATAAETAQTAAETAQGAAEDAQEAAEAVLASIPSDYTELSEDVDDLKSATNNDLLPSTALIQRNVVFSKNAAAFTKTVDVSSASFANIVYYTNDLIPAAKDDRFTVAYRIKTSHSPESDYVYQVRFRKYTQDGATGTYYHHPAEDDNEGIFSFTPPTSDVANIEAQIRYKYVGTETSNYSETFTVEYLYVYKNDIYLYNDVALTKANAIEAALAAGLLVENLTENVRPHSFMMYSNAQYPNVDTEAQTITFFRNTAIYGINGENIYTAGEDITVNLFTSVSASRVLFDTKTQTFICVNPATDRSAPRYITLGIIRNSNGRGWLGIPHTVNGYNPYEYSADPKTVLPDSWASKVQEIQEGQGTKFSFAVQTDTHFSGENSESSGNNLKVLTQFVGFDFAANLGDVISGYADETRDAPDAMRAAMTEIMHRYVTGISCPLMIAMGNHDTNKMWADAYDGDPFALGEVWGREFRPAFNTNPRAVTKTGLMYYYTDFENVRVIVLDTQDGGNGAFGIGQTQIDWLTNTALNTDKAVLVLSHVPLVDGWSISSNYDSSYANAVSAIKAYQTNGGTVIGCMSGHTHTQETQTVNGILYVTFTNGGDLCEVVQVDITNKTINTIPVGFTGVGNRSFTFA